MPRRRQLDDDREPEEKARDAAMRMLAMREHAVRELDRKLRRKGFGERVVAVLMTELKDEGLVSDARFAEMLVHSRQSNGYGPVRISHELREKGVDDDVISEFLDFGDGRWLTELERVRDAKYGETRPGSYREWAKRASFLANRGFSAEQVRQVLGDFDGYDERYD